MGFSNILRLNLKEGSDKVFDSNPYWFRCSVSVTRRLEDRRLEDLLRSPSDSFIASWKPGLQSQPYFEGGTWFLVHGFCWRDIPAKCWCQLSVGVNYQTVNWSQLFSTMPKVCVIKTDNTALDALSRSPHVILWYCKVHWWHAIASSIKHHLEPDCSLGR